MGTSETPIENENNICHEKKTTKNMQAGKTRVNSYDYTYRNTENPPEGPYEVVSREGNKSTGHTPTRDDDLGSV